MLKNQIAMGQVFHAYLFSGSRGTGKTSTAKILAHAVNCQNPIDGEPCFECAACREIMGTSADIIELDAASNNRVDDVRALIEKAVFTPINLTKKVYIIDEAHMLTQQAFNALLKTLEEPPEHVLFILATTEPQKILPTITSRCQRFDFRKLVVSDIVECLKDVLSRAGASIEQDGLISIARKANGGMRDALSLADQCLSLCGNVVTAADVHHVLGDVDRDFLFAFADAIISSDAKNALFMLDEVCSGRDISLFIQDVAAHFRALLMTSICGSCADFLDCTQEEADKLLKQAADSNPNRLMRVIDILSNTQTKTRFLQNPRPLIEVDMLRAMRPESDESIDSLLDRIAVLESKAVASYVPTPKQEPRDNTAITPETAKSVQTVKKQAAPKKQEANSTGSIDPTKLYNDIIKKLIEGMSDTEKIYTNVSLSKAMNIQVTDGTLQVYFADRTHFETAQKYKAELENILLKNGHGLKFNAVMIENSAEDDLEKTLKDTFGNSLNIID